MNKEVCDVDEQLTRIMDLVHKFTTLFLTPSYPYFFKIILLKNYIKSRIKFNMYMIHTKTIGDEKNLFMNMIHI